MNKFKTFNGTYLRKCIPKIPLLWKGLVTPDEQLTNFQTKKKKKVFLIYM